MVKWHLKQFTELTVTELWQIYHQRNAVFMIEKDMPNQDIDQTDKHAYHIWSTNEAGIMTAYARFYPIENGVSFGRVLTPLRFRGHGFGKQLIAKMLEAIEQRFPNQTIRIHSMADRQSFYEQFGFVVSGQPFLEINIPHLLMIKKC